MSPRLLMIAACVTVAALPRISAAQVGGDAPDAESPARVQLGPLAVRPQLVVRDVGFDSNVRQDADGGRGDVTATLGAKADTSFRARRLRVQSSHHYEYRHFLEVVEQRGANRGTDGRADVLLGRLHPYISGALTSLRERPNAEVDARARRLESRAGTGLHAAVFSRTTLHVGWLRTSVDYADDEIFRAIRLADQLNAATGTWLLGADIQLTPFTAIAVHGEQSRERFSRSPLRDADSSKYGITVSLDPQALIAGRLSAGVRRFRPLTGGVPEFAGLAASIAASYAYRDQARIGVTLERDVRHSIDEETPYYVSTGGRVTFVHRLFGRFDGQLLAGGEQLAYQPRRGVERRHLRDYVRIAGGGIGVRMTDRSRLAVLAEYSTRTSPAQNHEYSRARIYATLAYGF